MDHWGELDFTDHMYLSHPWFSVDRNAQLIPSIIETLNWYRWSTMNGPLINTWSWTCQLTLNWHLSQTLVESRDLIKCWSIHVSWSTLNSFTSSEKVTVEINPWRAGGDYIRGELYWQTLDGVPIRCHLRCWWSVDLVSIEYRPRCWSSVYRDIHYVLIKGWLRVSINTWPQYTWSDFTNFISRARFFRSYINLL